MFCIEFVNWLLFHFKWAISYIYLFLFGQNANSTPFRVEWKIWRRNFSFKAMVSGVSITLACVWKITLLLSYPFIWCLIFHYYTSCSLKSSHLQHHTISRPEPEKPLVHWFWLEEGILKIFFKAIVLRYTVGPNYIITYAERWIWAKARVMNYVCIYVRESGLYFIFPLLWLR